MNQNYKKDIVIKVRGENVVTEKKFCIKKT